MTDSDVAVVVQGQLDVARETIFQLESDLARCAAWGRHLEREIRKQRDQINRISNLTPGRSRLHQLGRVAAALEYEADEMMPDPRLESLDSALPVITTMNDLRRDALFLRRLEHDFEQLRDAVRGETRPRVHWPRP